MKKLVYCIFLLFFGTFLSAQINSITTSVEADIVGGKQALDQVLQTQLTLPKTLLSKNFEQTVILYFELDSANKPLRVTFNSGLNNVLRKELLRIISFLKFRRKNAINETPFEYYLTLNLSTEKYNRYLKQKTKPFVKNKSADSSMVVFARADKSPDYYKNSDEGLAEYILSNIEYPSVAREKSIEGTVVLELIVETNGFVTGVEVKQGVGGGCSEEAMRLLKETRWQPAEINGNTVRYRMTYPITFSLKNNFRDNTSPKQEPY